MTHETAAWLLLCLCGRTDVAYWNPIDHKTHRTQAYHNCGWNLTRDGVSIFEYDPHREWPVNTRWTVIQYERNNFAPLAGVERTEATYDGTGRNLIE